MQHNISSFITNFLPTLSLFNLYNSAVLLIGAIVSIGFFCEYKKTKSRQLLNSLPGVWTSLGLLGTFIAICTSLGGISSQVVIDNVGKTVAEATPEIDIKRIIGDLIPAFSTSIYGLFFATLITIVNKVIYAKEDKIIDDEINNVSPEKYIYDIAVELKAQTAKNAEYNERLNTTLGSQSAILEKFVNDFVLRMDEIFKEMGQDIRKNITEFGNEQFTNSAELIQNIVEKMAASTNVLISQQSENVTSLMSNTNSKLEGISSQINSSISAISNSACESMSTMMAGQKSSMEKIITEQQENLDALIEKNNAFNSQIIDQSAELNKQVSDNLRESLSNITDKLQKTISEQCATLSLAITNCVDKLKESYSFINDHIAAIRSDYQQATEAYRDAVQNAHDINDSFEHTIRSIDDSLKALDTTNNNVSIVADIVKERYEKIEHLVATINEMSTAIDTLRKLESQLNKINNRD